MSKFVKSAYDSPAEAVSGVLMAVRALNPGEFHQCYLPHLWGDELFTLFEGHICKTHDNMTVSRSSGVAGLMMRVDCAFRVLDDE